MFDKDALEYLTGLARFSDKRVVPIPGDPLNAHYLVGADGAATYREPPRVLAHRAADLDAVVAKANQWEAGEVWCNRTLVSAHRGADSVRMELTDSPQMAEVRRWGPALQWEQKPLIRMLRTVLAGCVQAVDLVALVRKVDVSRAERVAQEQQRGKVSMSREMMAEVSGASALPDTFTITFPVFAQASLRQIRASVEVALDVDAEQKAVFTLIPLAGQVEAAYGKAEDELVELLTSLYDADGVETLVLRGTS